jgi:hypothetical protein
MGESTLSIRDKHRLYEKSVQAHEGDIEFINEQYTQFYKKLPLSLREDFGGSGILSCAWTAQSSEHQAWAIDLDTEPIAYGVEEHYSQLDSSAQERMKYIEGNVLDDYDFKADVICAFNFSYFIFKKRKALVDYFKKVRQGITEDGMFIVDLFGGTECRQELEEETEYDDHDYFWDCDKYNPFTNECLYYIHFRYQGKKHEKVFTYDWRQWTIPEVREAMEEAGFSRTYAYWEGEDEDGDGDGNFYISEEEENCDSWVTYIVGLP